MTKQEIKELLEKQLQILSEQKCPPSTFQCDIANTMIRVADAILQLED